MSGDKPLKFQVVCPQNGAAVLKGLKHLVGKFHVKGLQDVEMRCAGINQR